MSVRSFPLIVALMLTASPAMAQPPSVMRFEDATIVATSGAWPFDAGIFATWIRLDLMHENEQVEVYALQLFHDEPTPPAGALCSIEASIGRVHPGSVRDGRGVPTGDVLVASRIVCDGQEYLIDG